MPAFTAEKIESVAKELLEKAGPTFEWTDLLEMIPEFMEIAGSVEGMTNEEKFETVCGLVDYIADNTDMWGPDVVWDPLTKKGARVLIPVFYRVWKGDWSFKSEAELADKAEADLKTQHEVTETSDEENVGIAVDEETSDTIE